MHGVLFKGKQEMRFACVDPVRYDFRSLYKEVSTKHDGSY
jgi:hypothetical protein